MADRITYPGTETDDDPLEVENFDKLPGGWLGYEDVTANQTGLAGTGSVLTGLEVDVTVNTARKIRITAKCNLASDVAGDDVGIRIYEGGTVLDSANAAAGRTSVSYRVRAEVVLNASAGSHTYFVTGGIAGGTGNGTLAASATSKAEITVEDLGPAS